MPFLFPTRMSKPQLKPTKLIPALVRYSQRRRDAMNQRSLLPAAASNRGGVGDGEDLAIKYLEFCVNDLKLKARVWRVKNYVAAEGYGRG